MTTITGGAEESLYLQQLLDNGHVDDAAVQRLALRLYTARAVREAVEHNPRKVHDLIQDAATQWRSLRHAERWEVVKHIHSEFGLDACVKHLCVMGYQLQGVEWPERVSVLGSRPRIELDGRIIYEGEPHNARTLFDVLSKVRAAEEHNRAKVLDLLGVQDGGELVLMRHDGVAIETTVLPSPAPESAFLPGQQ